MDKYLNKYRRRRKRRRRRRRRKRRKSWRSIKYMYTTKIRRKTSLKLANFIKNYCRPLIEHNSDFDQSHRGSGRRRAWCVKPVE